MEEIGSEENKQGINGTGRGRGRHGESIVDSIWRLRGESGGAKQQGDIFDYETYQHVPWIDHTR